GNTAGSCWMKPGGSGTRRWTSSTAAPPCWMTKGREPMSRATDEVYREESSNGLESVEIDSRWGPVEVMASPGDHDPVKVRAIRIEGTLTGTSSLVSRSGAIDVSGIDGRLDAETSSGRIRVRGRLAGGSSLASRSGGISVDGIDGNLAAETSSGGIRVRGHLT